MSAGTYILGVKYLFDMQYVSDVPGILGEGAQRQSVFTHEARGRVGQAALLVARGDTMLQTVKELLRCMEH